MKHKLAVYHHRYLPYSETFIYRQLMGLGRYFDIKLITHGLENKEEFPGFAPLVVPPRSVWRNLIRYNYRFFAKHLRGSDLFHVNFGHIAVNMQDYAVKAGIPMTAYFLGVDASAFLKDKVYCERLGKASFNAAFVNSEDMKHRIAPYLPEGIPCHVVYCGIPLDKFPFKQRHSISEGTLFLQVSRFEPKKGVDITLKAFSTYLKESDPKARLIIAGGGRLKEELHMLAHSLGLNEQVSFEDRVVYKRYLELLQDADVFLHPSVTAPDGDMEGLPNAICEAMACGLPVISTRHSGIPEVIQDGRNGFLVEERDVQGLYEAMVALKNRDMSEISRNARAIAEEKFDQDKTTSLLAKHMDQIISGGNL